MVEGHLVIYSCQKALKKDRITNSVKEMKRGSIEFQRRLISYRNNRSGRGKSGICHQTLTAEIVLRGASSLPLALKTELSILSVKPLDLIQARLIGGKSLLYQINRTMQLITCR